MVFAGFNIVAVLLAMIAAMAIGAFWCSVLAKRWIVAAGFNAEQIESIEKGGNPAIYVIAALSHLVMAIVLAGLIGHLGDMSLWRGIVSALYMWAGFVVTTMVVNHRFQMKPWSLTTIDAGHYLFVLIAQGAIIGWMGV